MEFWRGLGNLVTGGAIDRSEAKDTIQSANWQLESAQQSLEMVRKDTETSLQNYGQLQLEVAAGSLTEFAELFSQLEKLEQTELKQNDHKLANLPGRVSIGQIRQVTVAANEVLGAVGAGAVGAGAAGGAVAYAGAMGLAGLIGTASTGTAIGALSGAAATNATLAWLGGGALSTGGLGMAGGMMVLGGIALAPFALILGGIGASKAKQQLYEAEIYYDKVMVEVSKMRTLETELSQIRRGAELLSDLIATLSSLLEHLNSGISDIIQNKKERDAAFAEQLYQTQLAERQARNPLVRFFANIFKPIKKIKPGKRAISAKLAPPPPYLPKEDTHLTNSFNTASLLVKILNTPLMGEDGAFLSEPIEQLTSGARTIIDSSFEADGMRAVEQLNQSYLPVPASK